MSFRWFLPVSLRSKPLKTSKCPVTSEAPDAAGSASPFSYQSLRSKLGFST